MQSVLLLLLALSSILSSCVGQPTRMKFCGAILADALRHVCREYGYNAPGFDEGHDDSRIKKPTRYRIDSNSGVATECCVRGCSWRTMNSYCAEPSKSLNSDSGMDGDLKKLAMVIGHGRAARLAAASDEQDEIDAEAKRSAPLFGTVSPEYHRLPRTLDEVPYPYNKIVGF